MDDADCVFVCPKCNSEYLLDREDVDGKVMTTQCRQCCTQLGIGLDSGNRLLIYNPSPDFVPLGRV